MWCSCLDAQSIFFSFSLKPNNFTRLYLGVGHSGSSFSGTLYAFPMCSFKLIHLFFILEMLGEAPWLKPPTLARHHSNYLHEFFTTGGPGKEQGTNKPPPTRRVRERSKGDTTCLTTSQNPSLWHPSWLNKACTTRKDSESEWLAKDNPETSPITIKPETVEPRGRAVLPVSLTLLLSAWVPLPSKISCFLSTCVSSDSSFPSVRQEPTFGPWKGSLPATVVVCVFRRGQRRLRGERQGYV